MSDVEVVYKQSWCDDRIDRELKKIMKILIWISHSRRNVVDIVDVDSFMSWDFDRDAYQISEYVCYDLDEC